MVGMESRSIRSAREAWTDILGGCVCVPGVRGGVVVCCGVWVADWEVGGFGGREVGAVFGGENRYLIGS